MHYKQMDVDEIVSCLQLSSEVTAMIETATIEEGGGRYLFESQREADIYNTALEMNEELECDDRTYEYVDLDEAMKRANETDYGLSFSIFTESEANYQRAMIEVPSGIINWNRATNGASGRLPFGGVGKSGNHRPAALMAPEYCSYPVASLSKPYGEFDQNPSPGFPQEVWK